MICASIGIFALAFLVTAVADLVVSVSTPAPPPLTFKGGEEEKAADPEASSTVLMTTSPLEAAIVVLKDALYTTVALMAEAALLLSFLGLTETGAGAGMIYTSPSWLRIYFSKMIPI